MIMSNLDALGQFEESLKMAEELMKLERKNFRNPPRTEEQNAVEGLRGGAIVLLVAAWESFVKQLLEEELAQLATNPPKVKFHDLPEKMQTHNVFHSLEMALKGPRFRKTDKIDRLPDIERVVKNIILGIIDPQAFSDIGYNPKPQIVKEMFSNIGINNIFAYIQEDFQRKWNHPASEKLIMDKLEGILNLRHAVAHKADTLNISRKDLKDDIRFMKILAGVIEKKVRQNVREIVEYSSKS
jgi:hypothetical protein